MEENKSFKNMLKLIAFGILLYCAIQNYILVIRAASYLLHLIFPFLLGGIIAFIINVPMRMIEQWLPDKTKFRSFRRPVAYLITLVLIIGIFVLALFVIIPQISNTILLIMNQIPGAFRSFQEWIFRVTKNLPNVQSYLEELNINWSSISSHAVSWIKTAGSTILTSGFGIVSGIVGGVANFIIAFTFSIYLLFQKEKLGRQLKQTMYAVLPEAVSDRIIYIGKLSNHIFSNFLSGQCIEAVILGTMFFVTLSVFRMPYALLIGVIIAITALIPIFGAFIGCFVGILLIVMVNPVQAIWFVVIFLVLQQIEGNLIYPHVVGGSIGLPSIWVLVAVTIGGSLMGIAGILLFIPLCSVCYSLFRTFVKDRLVFRKIPTEKWNAVVPLPEEQLQEQKKAEKKRARHAKKLKKK